MSLALGARPKVKLLQSACTSMCRHIYDWNIVNWDVKQPIQLNFELLTTCALSIHIKIIAKLLQLGCRTALWRRWHPPLENDAWKLTLCRIPDLGYHCWNECSFYPVLIYINENNLKLSFYWYQYSNVCAILLKCRWRDNAGKFTSSFLTAIEKKTEHKPFGFVFVGVGAFVIGLSQISSFSKRRGYKTCKVIKQYIKLKKRLLLRCIHKYIKTSARVSYAPSVWKRAQVPEQKESRLTIRGDDDEGLNVVLVSIYVDKDTVH